LKKILIIAITLLGIVKAQNPISLGLNREKIYNYYITQENCEILEYNKDDLVVLDDKNVIQVYYFDKNITYKHIICFPIEAIDVETIVKLLDKKFYRLSNDYMIWLENSNLDKSKYIISYVLDYDTKRAIIVYQFNNKKSKII
jgi:hypothetical protein